MMRRMLSILLCLSLFGSMFTTSTGAVQIENQRPTPKPDEKAAQPLLFTEVYSDDKEHPDTEGANGRDLFEYVEIYNNTYAEIDFNSHYRISYTYDKKNEELAVSAEKDKKAVIPANSPAVLWVEGANEEIAGEDQNVTEDDFRSYHHIPDRVPVFKVRVEDGIADSDAGFIISKKDNKNAVISEVYFTKDDVADGKSFHTRIPKTGSKAEPNKQKGEASAGIVEKEQLLPPENNEPVIKHQAASSVKKGSDLKISAEAADKDGDSLTVKLFYKPKESTEFTEFSMKTASDKTYTYTIPASDLPDTEASYYITASDGKAVTRTKDFKTAIDSNKEPVFQKAANEKTTMPVFFTEIYPNDKANPDIDGAGSNDLFEYVELFNNTGSDIHFNESYKIKYNYVSNRKDLSVTSVADAQNKNVTIPANKPAVLWVERTSESITGAAKNLTEDDFRKYHTIPDSVPVFKLRGQDGLANADRGFLITNKADDEIISEAFYTNEDVADGKSLHLRVPKSGASLVNYLQKGNPSAGEVIPDQLKPSENKEPQIEHQPVKMVEENSDYKVIATITDADGDPLSAKLYYKTSEYADYTEKEMTKDNGNVFSYTIPKSELTGANVSYYIEASDGEANSRSADYTVPVQGEKSKTPSILITEIAPHPAGDYRLGTGNQYEYIEFYNNSDKPLNLKGYSLFYLYPEATEPKKWVIPVDTNIEPYSTGVIWFTKEAIRDGFTKVEDFNTHFNTTLKDSDVILYDNTKPTDFNLPNATNRGYAISSSDRVNDIIVEAWYDSSNASSPDRLVNDVRNSVIRYSYPDSGTKMKRLDTRNYANPGNIDKGQVPYVEGMDVVAPSIHHEQKVYNIEKNKGTKVTIESDEELAKSELRYGPITNEGTNFSGSTDLTFKEKTDGRYVYEGELNISEPGTYRYMIISEDKSGNVTKFPYNSLGNVLTVNEKGRVVDLPDKGLSLKEGAVLNDKVSFYAYGDHAGEDIQVTLNGKPLELRPALPGPVQFGFQSRGIDQIYQASSSAKNPAGKSEFLERLLPKYLPEAWYLYEVLPEYFVSGRSVSIHTGNESVPYALETHDQYFGKTNFDDFDVKNIHIVLPDGTLVKPESVRNYLGSKAQTDVSYRENTYFALGDGGGGSNLNKPLISEFNFPIPAEKYTARYAEMDTSNLADGSYSLEMKIGNESIEKVETTVDNTKPVIKGIKTGTEGYLEDSESLKGPITFSVEAEDNLSGVSKVEAVLDEKPIALPHETSSAILSPGEHIITVTAYDGAGNKAEKSVTFHIGEEKPHEPSEVSPEDFAGSVPRNATLRAKVTDPSGDLLDVGFYKGSKYDFARKGKMKGFMNVADREPPLSVAPSGETAMKKSEQDKIAYEDGKYLVSDSPAGFPYHRFEVSVEEELSASTVELYWKGKTLPNRKVTLYAWDYHENKWKALKSEFGNPQEKDIVLSAAVEINRFVKNGKIQAMVQDEIKNPNDPFTMLWFTDTQYYAESYPHIFDTLGDWIVDEYKKGKFEYAINTGDLVNIANDETQWQIADRNLKKLDEAGVPYGVLSGNHDVIIDGLDYSYYHQYVGVDRYKDNPWFGGHMDNNRNHYDLMSFGGHDFIFLYLGFGTEDTEETIAWANEVLKQHSDRNAILAMHAYLEGNATLSKMAQNVFDRVVKPNDNVLMTVSGHYHGANRRVSTVTNSDGSPRKVLEMLADYQEGPEGGEGYVRYLTFDPAAGKLDVVTYSPYKDDYNFFDEGDVDTFTEDIQLKDYKKRVATDYFAANVYTDEKIGEQKDVESGGIASTEWKNLKANKTYYWYMNVSDKFGATRRSAIYRFTTGPGQSPHPEPPEDGGEDDGGNPIDEDPKEKDPIDKDPNDKDPNDKEPIEKDPDNNGGMDQDPKGKGSIDKDPVEVTKTANTFPQEKFEQNGTDPADFLPNTATYVYNWIFAGGVLFIGGITLLLLNKRKRVL